MRIQFVSAGLIVMMAIAVPAGAQQQDSNPTSAPERCQPQEGGQKRDGEESGDLSKKLDDCNGVLKAPQTGDPDMVEPAPDTGGGRVIDPNSLPEGANPSNGSGG
jgi:hypothetical protein